MRPNTAVILIVSALAAAAGFAGITSARGSAAPADNGAAARGAKAWAENCASCHNIRSPLEKSDRQWATAAVHMRVRGNIPGDVVNDIIVFLQGSNAAPESPAPAIPAASASAAGSAIARAVDPSRGARIYGETCVACHGANGKGAIEGVPDLADRLTKSDNQLLENIIKGFQTPGSPMPMPARGGNPDLSDEELADALAYIRQNFSR